MRIPAVIDLRQYTMVPGRRDELIELFDDHFVDGQEAVGIHVLGQFRDLDDPDMFVWLRGYDSMPDRAEGLARFYYGPMWQAHREHANAMMIDSGNALLLEPLEPTTSWPDGDGDHGSRAPAGLVAIKVAYLDGELTATDDDLARRAAGVLSEAGAEVVGPFRTHVAANNFPLLPLRDERVLVWVMRFADEHAYNCIHERLGASSAWASIEGFLAWRGSGSRTQHLRLRPTGRSRLR